MSENDRGSPKSSRSREACGPDFGLPMTGVVGNHIHFHNCFRISSFVKIASSTAPPIANALSETREQALASSRGSTSPIFKPLVTWMPSWINPRHTPAKGLTTDDRSLSTAIICPSSTCSPIFALAVNTPSLGARNTRRLSPSGSPESAWDVPFQ